MPRLDRRFTAEDVARIYCRNLSIPNQILARRILDTCGIDDRVTDEQVADVLDLLASTLSDIGVPFVPQALSILASAVRSADPGDIKVLIDQMGLVGEPSS